MNWVIYVLKDPRTDEVRYVGWTKKSARARLGNHINEVAKYQRTHKQRWIASLLGIGLRPEVEVIESGEGPAWAEAEIRWIAFYRGCGADLVNSTDGGEGVIGWGTPSERSAVAAKREADKKPETKALVSKKARDRMAAMTPQQWQDLAKKRLASKTKEEWCAVAKSRDARMSPEERSQRARNAFAATDKSKLPDIAAKRYASHTPEEWSAMAQQRIRTKEQYRAAAVKRISNSTHEERKEWSRRSVESGSHEQRSESAKRRMSRLSPEQLAAQIKRMTTAITPETRAHMSERRWSGDAREEQSRKQRELQAKRTPEQRSASAKLGVSRRVNHSDGGS